MIVLIGLLTLGFGQGQQFEDLGKIVKGIDANRGDFPWHVGLKHKSWGYQCGASILSPYWVLTAAHCIGDSESEYSILAGDHDITIEDGESEHHVVKIIKHEKWNPMTIANDVALLKLENPIVLIPGKTAAINLLRPSMKVNPGEKVILSGWGKLYSGGPTSAVLQSAELEIISLDYCKSKYPLKSGTICAGTLDGSRDACNQDSGGPLVINRFNTWYQVGIVSYGHGCALATYPGVYADIAYYFDWIQRRMTNN